MGARTIPAAWNKQHNADWRSWISSLPAAWGDNACERDEYPPIRFMEKDEDKRYTQWLRFLQKRDNRDAGKLWQGKCGKAKSKTADEGGPINGKTCTLYRSIEFTITAFSLDFANTAQASGRIASNPCLPTMITDDPGFALMVNDRWYEVDNILAGYMPQLYEMPPDGLLTAGLTMPRNRPAKRWLDMEWPMDLDWRDLDEEVYEILSQRPPSYYPPTEKLTIDPESIIVDEGNSSRNATPQELWEKFGLFKCQSPGCPDERKAAGLWVDEADIEKLVQPTSDAVISTTAAAGSLPSGLLPSTTLRPSMTTFYSQEMMTSTTPVLATIYTSN